MSESIDNTSNEDDVNPKSQNYAVWVPHKNPSSRPYKEVKHSMVDLTPSTYCQARCPSCARTGDDGLTIPGLKLEHLSIDILKKMVKSTRIFNETSIIRLSGDYGDPMMHPNIEEIIDICVNNAEYVIISTNGALRNAKWYTHIGNKYKYKLRIIFGIDGTNQEINNLYRVDVNFAKAYENMKAFATTPSDAEWQYIIFNHNYHQMGDAIQMATDIGCSLFFLFNRTEYNAVTDEQEMMLAQKYNINSPLWKLVDEL